MTEHAYTWGRTVLHARTLDRNKNCVSFVFVCILRLYLVAVLVPFLKL